MEDKCPVTWSDDEFKSIKAIPNRLPKGIIVEQYEMGPNDKNITLVKVHLRVFGLPTYVIFVKSLTPYGLFYLFENEFGQFGNGMTLDDCLPPSRWLARLRSEEHTYELQSLMRITYAVFCL